MLIVLVCLTFLAEAQRREKRSSSSVIYNTINYLSPGCRVDSVSMSYVPC